MIDGDRAVYLLLRGAVQQNGGNLFLMKNAQMTVHPLRRTDKKSGCPLIKHSAYGLTFNHGILFRVADA